jgi:hypothetical protein
MVVDAGLGENARPQELTLDEWVRLNEAVIRSSDHWVTGKEL